MDAILLLPKEPPSEAGTPPLPPCHRRPNPQLVDVNGSDEPAMGFTRICNLHHDDAIATMYCNYHLTTPEQGRP